MSSDAPSARAGASASAFFAGNQHNDVLLAKPEDDAAKERLVAELKRRGNAAFKCGSLGEADALYSKALDHDGAVAALFGNRSMTRAGMGRFEEALADAEAAIKVDGSWAKGYFRKAKAETGLERLDAAEASYRSCLEAEPGNKAAEKELQELPAKRAELKLKVAEREKRAEAVAATKKANESERVVSRRVVAVDGASTGKDGKAKAKGKGKEADMSMRGYRTLADGRKTTFFNRELTDAEKEMLKDNKPQQLAAEDESIKVKEESLASKGASAWNHGGTFEERSMTEFALQRLKECVLAVTCPVQIVDADGEPETATIKVTDLEGLEGDASITFTRGKQRHIFDFNFAAAWTVDCAGAKVSGTLFLPDVSGDAITDGEVVEAELRWSARDRAGTNQAAIAKALMDTNPASGLLGGVNKAVHTFADEFRALK